ncbi:1-phosphatidylinositol phosphodiesterase [Paramyrothecium foliicola]|nr:1-phosphatidylinositol phosphodiesterase [Paramyrothecium foliicola]
MRAPSLLILSLCAVLVTASCYRGYTSSFSFDVGRATHADWMGDVPDDTYLTALSIPGTHDTMAYDIRDQVWQCQNRNLSVQLDSGVRYFDIRGRLVNNLLDIYHSVAYIGYSYEDVLLGFFDFLEQHPSETIVMRLKQESTAINSTIPYEDAFLHYLWNNTATAERAQKHLHILPQGEAYAPIPKLGEFRGKVLILQDFPSRVPNRYGIGWESSDMVLQDLWEIENVASLWKKWDAIEASLIKSATAPNDNRALFLSHLSASVGVLPIEAAAGPLNRTVVGMNDETGDWLTNIVNDKTNPKYGKTGIVITDFPGQKLVDAVLERNSHLFQSTKRQ